MKRYEERRVGVFDRELGRLVLPQNAEWKDYDVWLRAGNEPAPEEAPALPSMPARRREVAARVNGVRSKALSKMTVTVAGYTFDADTASYANLMGVGLLLLSGEVLPPGFTWRTADNQLVAMTAAQVRALIKAMVQERERIYRRSWQLKDEVIAASDAPETIDIEEGFS